MNRVFLITFWIFFIAGRVLAQADLAKNLADAKRWANNSSGEMKITQEENAIRFDVIFDGKQDMWMFPRFAFADNENGSGLIAISFDAKTDRDDNVKYAAVLIGGVYHSWKDLGTEWKRVTITFKSFDKSKARTIQIGMNPKQPGASTLWLRNFEVKTDGKPVDLATLSPAPKTPVVMALRRHGAAWAFYDTEPLTFELKESQRGAINYHVADYADRTVATGVWPADGAQPLTLTPLPRGYYTLSLESSARVFSEPLSFAVVPDVAKKPPILNSFFAVDSAQTWLCGAKNWNDRYPGAYYELISEMARRAGIQTVRDRIGWKGTESNHGQYDFKNNELNAKLLSECDIQILNLVDQTPPWARTLQDKQPDDLLALYQYSQKLGQTFSHRVVAWGYGNETDNGLQGSVWNMVAAYKAAALGFRAGDPAITLLNGAFHETPLQPYAQVALKNDMGKYFDVMDFHVYESIGDYPYLISRLRKEMTRYGIGDMPIWITENGTNVEGPSATETYRAGTLAHSASQERLVAEFIPKAMITMQSLGVARDFFFALPPFWERSGRKDWGLMRIDLTLKPGYVAMATLNDQLAAAHYLGTYDAGEPIAAYLYQQPNGAQTLVYWSRSIVDSPKYDGKDRNFALALPAGDYTRCNIYGTPEALRPANGSLALTATRLPNYLTGLRGLKVATPAPSVGRPGAIKSNDDLTIVLNPVLGEGFKPGNSAAFAEITAPQGRITLTAFNLSAQEKTGTLQVKNARVIGLPDQVTLAPFSKQEFAIAVTPELGTSGFKADLEFGGTFNGKPITHALIPLLKPSAMLENGRRLELGWKAAAKWRANASGQMQIAYDDAEQAVRMETKCKADHDNWIYPEYALNYPAESLAGAVAVTFEIKAGPEVKTGVSYAYVMAVFDKEKEKGKSFWIRYPQPTEQWEKRVVVLDGFDPADVRMLRIGLNPKNSKDFTYYVRNVTVVFDK